MSNGNGHRWSKFWWQDWKNDDALLGCSMAARGFWMALLCIAHEATPCGHVLINGKAPSARELAMRMGNTTAKEVAKLLAELEEAKVFSRKPDGTIYSRRMEKDAAATEAGREHIAKRWSGEAKPTDPPNRGANRVPNRKPNGEATSFPTSPPITREAEADSDLESRERKKESLKTLTLPLPTRDRAREQQALEDEKPARTDRTNDAPPTADPLAAALIQRAADAIKMRVPYGEVRSREEQVEALATLAAQPEVEEVMGMAWQPAPPVRTLEQQIAAATASASPEQIERARIAFAMRAGGYAAPPMAAAR